MSVENFRIDGHKLHLHPQRVADWLEGRAIAPIYLEISPSGACNHRCRFCAMDFLGYRTRFLPGDILAERLAEMGRAGVRAVMFAGEGEPFLHPDMPRLARRAKEAGLDLSFTTNAVLLTCEKAAEILPVTSWIKISLNAGSADTYARVHGAKPEDFETVLANLAEAAELRKRLSSTCALGVQMVLLPENQTEAAALARRAREAGADYLVIKPYSIHRQSHKSGYLDLSYGDLSALAEELAALNTATFKTVFRHQALARLEEKAVYNLCQALPFWGYVDSGGSVWGCLRHIGEENFNYGNIIDQSFEEILSGPRVQKMACFSKGGDIGDCRLDCRMDSINAYLWELTHPGPHLNFI